MKNFVRLQDDYECVYGLADLHAITVRQEPAALRKNVLEAYALLLAMGIDLEKSIFFIQSQVPDALPSWPGCSTATPSSASSPA